MNRKFTAFLLVVASFSGASSQNLKNSVVDTSTFGRRYPVFSGQDQAVSGLRQEQSGTLRRFGADVFTRGLSSLDQPQAEVYVLPPNYRLGPGDRLGVFLLGQVQENREVTVNVEGKVFVPPVGVLAVWGLEMNEFRDLLSTRLSQFYDNFKLDVMLLRPKNVLIAVVGEVEKPGKYVLSAMNTVIDAIMLAGGPTATGSIRNVQIIRDSTVHASIDLYKFLTSQTQADDEFLQAGDRIFVPFALKHVTVSGEINRPAVFELKPGLNERVSDVIDLAGGLTEYAFPDRIEISRLQSDGQRKLLYANFHEILTGDLAADIVLKNEDEVHVYSKLEQIHDREVSIFGEIRKPGTYSLEEDMRLRDLILKAGSLTRKAYTLEAEIAKVDPGKPTQYLKVNLEELNNGTNGHTNILLEEDDQVFIRQIPEWEVGHTVEVRGEMMFPGKYAIIKDETRLTEILSKAGGFTDEAFVQEARVVRRSSRLKVDKEYERLKGMRREEMSDLEYQYLVMRQNTAEVDEVVVDFEKLIVENDLSQDIILEHGDIIDVPRAPRVVTVTGRVANAGGVTHQPNANLKYYLSRAGGASWDADLGKTKVIKVSGEVLDDEDVQNFQSGDIIWVPRKSDKKIWPTVVQTISVAAQLASIYLIIDTARNR